MCHGHKTCDEFISEQAIFVNLVWHVSAWFDSSSGIFYSEYVIFCSNKHFSSNKPFIIRVLTLF